MWSSWRRQQFGEPAALVRIEPGTEFRRHQLDRIGARMPGALAYLATAGEFSTALATIDGQGWVV